MKRAFSSLACVAALVFGCGDDCTDVGCEMSLIVELAADGGFADGAYEVTLSTPQGDSTCSFTIADGSAGMSSCSEGVFLESSELPSYMLVYAYDQPETLTVAVSRDGGELTRAESTPEYEPVQVDADACGTCTAAQVSVPFSVN